MIAIIINSYQKCHYPHHNISSSIIIIIIIFIACNNLFSLSNIICNSGCKNGKLRLFYCDWPKREYDFENNESINTEINHLPKFTLPQSSSQSSLSLAKDQDNNIILQKKLKVNLIENFKCKSTIYGHYSSIHSIDSFDYRKESLVVTCCSDLIIRVFNIESG